MILLLTHLVFAAPVVAPTLLSPDDGGETAPDPTLSVAVDAESEGVLTVTFRGRPLQATADDFTIIAMPDTQFYACGCSSGSTETFGAQTAWIAEQITALNIAYVAQLGDCVEHGDSYEDEWLVADDAFAAFDEGRSTFALPAGGLPYGIAVGNHDQSPMGSATGTTTYYNQYFGYDRFYDRGWYGGFYGADFDNHYDLFDAGGLGFVVLYFEYDSTMDAALLEWADSVLSAYPDRHGIVVAHYLLGADAELSNQGQDIYDALSMHSNFGLMLAGHVAGEARRSDEGARTVHTLLSDYQARSGGGDGWLRILSFSPTSRQISVSTYSPTLDSSEEDEDSLFTLDWDPDPTAWTELGTAEVVDGVASLSWTGLEADASYEWTAELSDGVETASAGPWTFTVVEPVVVDTGGDTGDDTGGEDSALRDDSGGAGDDTAEAEDSDSPVVDTGVKDTGTKVSTGDCGCASGVGASGGLGLFFALVLARRRSRDDREIKV